MSHDTSEKANGATEFETQHVEAQSLHGSTKASLHAEQMEDGANIDEGYDPAFVKRTMRKVDWRVVPILSLMYCISLADRTNLATARAANNKKMDTELGTALGQRYSIMTLMFFVPYIILEIPSQFGLRKFGVRIWLGGAVCAWGFVMLGMGFAPTWNVLAALRAVLGAFEAVLFPGATYLLSCWYPRRQMATRNVLFYMVAAVFGNSSSILGYAFSLLDGRAGMSGWQWLFILFGVLTVVIGIIAIIVLVDFPDKAGFLTEEERNLVMTRIQRDRGDAVPDPLTLSKCLSYATDFKPYLFGFMFLTTTLAAYSLSYFLPVILASMGFNNFESMVLNIPPQVWSVVPALAGGYIADRFRHCRAYVIMFGAASIVVGTALYSQLPKSAKGARYFGVFLAWQGANMNVPLVNSWAQTSIRSQSKRAWTAAIVVACGGIGGIVASVAFNQKEAKQGYPSGVWLTVAANSATCIFAFALHCYFLWRNRRADQHGDVLEGDEMFRYQG